MQAISPLSQLQNFSTTLMMFKLLKPAAAATSVQAAACAMCFLKQRAGWASPAEAAARSNESVRCSVQWSNLTRLRLLKDPIDRHQLFAVALI